MVFVGVGVLEEQAVWLVRVVQGVLAEVPRVVAVLLVGCAHLPVSSYRLHRAVVSLGQTGARKISPVLEHHDACPGARLREAA